MLPALRAPGRFRHEQVGHFGSSCVDAPASQRCSAVARWHRSVLPCRPRFVGVGVLTTTTTAEEHEREQAPSHGTPQPSRSPEPLQELLLVAGSPPGARHVVAGLPAPEALRATIVPSIGAAPSAAASAATTADGMGAVAGALASTQEPQGHNPSAPAAVQHASASPSPEPGGQLAQTMTHTLACSQEGASGGQWAAAPHPLRRPVCLLAPPQKAGVLTSVEELPGGEVLSTFHAAVPELESTPAHPAKQVEKGKSQVRPPPLAAARGVPARKSRQAHREIHSPAVHRSIALPLTCTRAGEPGGGGGVRGGGPAGALRSPRPRRRGAAGLDAARRLRQHHRR